MFALNRRRPGGPAPAAASGAPMRRDPAPSRWDYRYQRLMLTPLFRIGLRYGLPLVLIGGMAALWLANPANRALVTDRIDAAREMIHSRPEFTVSALEIIGAQPALHQAIEALVDVEFPVSSFQLDLDALRAAISEFTAVAAVAVRVRPGGTLEIAVTERVPVAVWRYIDGLRLIDNDGVMTGMILSRADRADLPLIAGDGAKEVILEALLLFRTAEPVFDRVRGLVRMGERRWDMVLDRDQRILLPSDDPVAALERVIALHEAQDLLSRDITIVDMRDSARPTIRLTEPAINIMRNVRETGIRATRD
ncbi:MAG: cell division protein FtsQ/DivIB [Rubellimicrobium sp.]|nr:cell division protein FtsQ/DivIB [Rubellimicrobium sp.]